MDAASIFCDAPSSLLKEVMASRVAYVQKESAVRHESVLNVCWMKKHEGDE